MPELWPRAFKEFEREPNNPSRIDPRRQLLRYEDHEKQRLMKLNVVMQARLSPCTSHPYTMFVDVPLGMI